MAATHANGVGPHCIIIPHAAEDFSQASPSTTLGWALSKIFFRNTNIKPAPSTFFILDEEQELSDNWQNGTFEYERGVHIPYYLSRAQNERGVIALVSGMKAHHPVTADVVKAYNDLGLSVVWINLPNPGRSLGIMEFYKDLTDTFFTAPHSPVQTEFDPEIPHLIQGHSTGGGIALDLITDPKTKYKYEHIALTVPEAPFMDNANASREDPALQRHLFTAYAKLNKNRLPHETLFGLFYLNMAKLKERLADSAPLPDASKIEKISFEASRWLYAGVKTVQAHIENKYVEHASKPAGIKSILMRGLYAPALALTWSEKSQNLIDRSYLNEYGTPTYGQILEIRKPHRKVVDRIVNDNAEPSTPVAITAGRLDSFSAFKPIMAITEAIGCDLYIADAGHNPIDTDSGALGFVIDKFEPLLPDIKPANDTKKDSSDPERDVIAKDFPKAARVWVSLPQFGTSLLDSATRFTQRLFGSSVRDTEVRGEPESRAMDRRHTL